MCLVVLQDGCRKDKVTIGGGIDRGRIDSSDELFGILAVVKPLYVVFVVVGQQYAECSSDVAFENVVDRIARGKPAEAFAYAHDGVDEVFFFEFAVFGEDVLQSFFERYIEKEDGTLPHGSPHGERNVAIAYATAFIFEPDGFSGW